MSGHGRGGEDEGIHPNAKWMFDEDGPDPVFVYHWQKRGRLNRSTGICGSTARAFTTSPGMVTCEACAKLLVKRGKRAA